MDHPHVKRALLPVTEQARAIAFEVTPFTRSGTGNISTGDACFLLSLIERECPTRILEIGVASGTSTLLMLRMMDVVAPTATLDSIDLAPAYYADTSKAVGYLVAEHYSAAARKWKLATKVSAATFASHSEFSGANRRRYYDLAFIDAHHSHPWPTLDTLCILPFVRPGSWVALHDINLPLLGDYPHFGAVYLTRDWSGDVVISDDAPLPNIGAIQLSDADRGDADRLIDVLAQPWDCGVHPYHSSKILMHLATCLPSAQLQAVQRSFERNATLPAG